MALRFEHRDTEIDVSLVDRVWRTRSDAEETMTSAARTCWHLILSRAQGRLLASLRGPETRATTAPVRRAPSSSGSGSHSARFFGRILQPRSSMGTCRSQ